MFGLHGYFVVFSENNKLYKHITIYRKTTEYVLLNQSFIMSYFLPLLPVNLLIFLTLPFSSFDFNPIYI